jgi:hypothetical protein
MKIQRLTVALAGGALLLAALALYERSAGAQSAPAVVRAQAIELVDARGRVRAQLNVADPGSEVIFRLRDARGTVRVKLGASATGSGLVLLDEATEPGVQLRASQKGTSLTLERGAKRRVLSP